MACSCERGGFVFARGLEDEQISARQQAADEQHGGQIGQDAPQTEGAHMAHLARGHAVRARTRAIAVIPQRLIGRRLLNIVILDGLLPRRGRDGVGANVALGSQITAVHIVQRVINARGARLRVHVAGGWRIAARQTVAADAALLLLAALTAGVQALHFAGQQITLIGARHGAVVVFHRVDYSRRRLGHVAVFAAPNAGALCVWLRQRRAAIKAFFKRGAVPALALGTFQGMILLDSKSETYRYSTPYVKIPAMSRYHGQMRAGRANAGRLQRRPGMV